MKYTREIHSAFQKNAIHYEKHAKVQYEIGLNLIERLDYIRLKPRYILDLGCGTGNITELLVKRYPKATVYAIDLAFNMLKESKQKQGWLKKWSLCQSDMQKLPFVERQFDLVIANQVIHWADAIPNLFKEIYRVMNLQGCLLFSTLGPDSFKELQAAWRQVDEYEHINPFLDMHDIGDHLLAQRFQDPVVDMEYLTIHYPSLPALLSSLKKQGVRNLNPKRNPGLTGRHILRAVEKAYQVNCLSNGKYPLTYEAVYGHAWKGEIHHKNSNANGDIFVSVEAIKRD